MNLVQIQERLKDLPTQAIMGYANGMNPQVPPYLALGELNRRKQMEQQAAQPPKGTVKDSIEQQVGLMQLQKLRQGQMAQQTAMQGSQAPTIPEGTPEPAAQEEVAMAAGGITRLPVGEMNFGSGGIIAFANPEGNQLVEDPMGTGAEAIMSQEKGKPDNRNIIERLLNAPEEPEWKRKLREEREAAEKEKQEGKAPAAAPAPAPVVEKPAGIATVVPPRPNVQARPTAVPAQPAAKTEAEKFQEGILAGRNMTALPPEYAPPKQAPIGEDYLKYMTDREQKRREDALKFGDVEKERAKRDFFNSLVVGAEKSRGQKGIGALVGSTGQTLGEYTTLAEERRMAFDKAQQELADNDAKTKFEIANLRRAEERGDAKAIYDSKVKISELGHQRDQLQGQVANSMASNQSAERVARANNLTQLEVARIHQATAGQPDATERMIAKYAEIKKTQGEAAAEEYMKTIERVKTGSRGETAQQRLSVQRQALAEKLPAYQMAMTTYINATDPAKKKAALDKVRELEAMHGIKSEEAPAIDTSQWGNPKVK